MNQLHMANTGTAGAILKRPSFATGTASPPELLNQKPNRVIWGARRRGGTDGWGRGKGPKETDAFTCSSVPKL